jgi:hypothetical protein
MVDHFLSDTQQLAAKIEGTAGTAETLTAAEVKLRPFKSDPPFTPDYPRFGNDEVSDDLAAAPDFVSGAKGTIPVGCILKSGGALGTEPAISPYLLACAMKLQTVRTITIGSISGGNSAFAAGETYSATGGKTGIIEYPASGAGALRYIVSTGAVYGLKYTPASTAQQTLTIQRADKNDQATSGQDFLYRLRGAMGKCTMTWTPLDAIRFAAEYQGVKDLAGAGSFFTGMTYEAGTPPKFISATVQIDGVDVSPDTITFDCGNTVEVDPAPTTADGGSSGFKMARVASREPTLSITPFRLIPSVLDDLGKLQSGATFAVKITTGATPQLIEFHAPKAQLRSWSAGDRAGRRTAALTLHLTRADLTDEDYAIYFR